MARWRHMSGDDPVMFSTGTDEHGQKVKHSADAAGQDCQEFCDEISAQFQAVFDDYGIGYTDFIRTTQPRHHAAVNAIWNALQANGHIYLGEYEGWYSVADESFYADNQVTPKGEDPPGSGTAATMVSLETGREVVRMRESNFMFRLSEFAGPIRKWIEDNPRVIVPDNRRREVLGMLDKGLPDLSVSRSAAGIQWGIPVPGADDHMVYVWLDALTNYLTVTGYPDASPTAAADVHVIGKDILKFHCIYWPAFLMAAGLPLPGQVVAHGHWTLDGQKISKSSGRVICPREQLATYGRDPMRYFLMKRGRLHDDADYTEEGVVEEFNQLVDIFGNLVSRVSSRKVNPGGMAPSPNGTTLTHAEDTLLRRLNGLEDEVAGHYDKGQFGLGVEAILGLLREANGYFEKQQPWKLAKLGQEERLRTVLFATVECLRVSALALHPVVPETAAAVLARLGVLGQPSREDWRQAGHLDRELCGTGHLMAKLPPPDKE